MFNISVMTPSLSQKTSLKPQVKLPTPAYRQAGIPLRRDRHGAASRSIFVKKSLVISKDEKETEMGSGSDNRMRGLYLR
jgi:hypothetical protein